MFKRSFISLKANDANLAYLIADEKDVADALGSLNKSTTSAAKYMQLMGDSEHKDLKEITATHAAMTKEYSFMLEELLDTQNEYRLKLKELEKASDQVHTTRKKLKDASDKCAKAIKSGKNVDMLAAERDGLERHLKNEIATFEQTKRAVLQNGLSTKANGLMKFSLKLQQYSMFLAHLSLQIPQVSLQPGEELPEFNGEETLYHINGDFQTTLVNIFPPMLDTYSKYPPPSSTTPAFNLPAETPLPSSSTAQQPLKTQNERAPSNYDDFYDEPPAKPLRGQSSETYGGYSHDNYDPHHVQPQMGQSSHSATTLQSEPAPVPAKSMYELDSRFASLTTENPW